MSLTSRRIYQFGEFELRVSARQLARDGEPVPLGSKAFEVLTCLVMRAGEVVTKDELLKTVWPESFVEEGNLAQHVFALRKALGDRSTYIVTVPGRGYQFAERVKVLADLPVAPTADAGTFLLQRTRERTHIVIDETSTAPGKALPQGASEDRELDALAKRQGGSVMTMVHDEITANRPPQTIEQALAGLLPEPGGPISTRGSFAAIAAVVVVALLAGGYVLRRLAHKPATSKRIVLAELDNRTGDPGFDDVLRDALKIDLDQSPYMDISGQAEELNTLRLMGQRPETRLVPEVAREVCERSNRQVLIAGTIANVGREYLLTLEATDCDSGKILAGAKAEAASKEQTLAALDSASAALRRGLGESNESLERFQVPIAQATTSSLEALKQYSIGEYLLGRIGKEEGEVLPFFQRAAELDPQFAMALAAIATSYSSLGESGAAAPYFEKAFSLSSQVSEKERLYIRAHYYTDDVRDVNRGLQAYEMWAYTYPRDWGPWLNIANIYSQLGQYGPAITAGEHALALDPSRGVVYGSLARDYMHAGQIANAETTAMRAVALGKDSTLLHTTLFETALLRQDRAAMDRQSAQGHTKEGEWNYLNLEALVAAMDGRYKRAEELFQAAYDAAMHESLPETASKILMDEASAELAAGMVATARSTLRRIQQPPDNPDVLLLLAELGDNSPAERALAERLQGSGSDTLMTYVYGPRIRAAIALHQAKPLGAIAELQPVAEYDFADGFGAIAERGESYLMAKEPEKAAIEFKRILDHPGIDPVSVLRPLAEVDLARAESQAGQIDQSKADYEAFFHQWSGADPDLPLLLAARKEYAALSSARR